MNYSLTALLFAITGGAFAQLLLKAGLIESADNSAALFVTLSGLSTLSIVFLTVGMVFYGSSMIAWIIALREYELSFAYPLLSLGYIIVYVGAVMWPGMTDSVSWQKSLGIFLIVFGVALSSQKSNPGLRTRHAIAKNL